MKPRLLLAAAAVGAVNALLFLGFEWLVKHGTDAIWNDLAHSDTSRWRVVPLAIAGSLALSLAARAAGQKRLVPVHTDPLQPHGDGENTTVATVAVTLAVGAVSLIGGASLGPEAPLAAASMSLGVLFARAQALVLASVGALLVAFFGSLLPIAIPLLLIRRREKRLTLAAALPPVIAGVAAFATLHAFSDGQGYGDLPASTHFDLGDLALAFALGATAELVTVWLKRGTTRFAAITQRWDARRPWWASAVLFGAGLGVFYLIGGESLQFTGSEGIGILLDSHYGTLALAGLAGLKLLATGWCLACGYRGGPVFPSVYVGVAISLALGSIGGPGATIGAVAGILTALTAPVVGAVMVLSMLPLKLVGVGLVGAAGAIAARRVLTPEG